MPTITVTCPSCRRQYKVEIEEGLTYEDMPCPDCGTAIPVAPAAAVEEEPAPAPETSPDSLRCPSCEHVFTPLFDLESHVGGMDCPNCGSGMPAPLEQYLVNPKPATASEKPAAPSNANTPPPAATFFFICSVASFIAGDIAAIADSLVLSSSFYWSGVSLILMAIYLKIQWK